MANEEKHEYDLIYEIEDELITLNAKLVTMHRLKDDVKEQAEMDIEVMYRDAKSKNDSDTIGKLSNEKLRKFETKNLLDEMEVQLPTAEEDSEGEFIFYNDLVTLIDECELEKQRLIRDLGFERRQFVREYGRAGMQALSETLL